MNTLNYYNVLVILPEYNLPKLTYSVDSSIDITIGDIIEVPFKTKIKFGVVIARDVTCDFDESKMKTIIQKLSLPRLTSKQLEFIEKASKYYLGPISSFLKMTIPIKKLPKEILPYKSTELNFNLAELSIIQEHAYKEISQYLNEKKYNTILLDGVTGSGKTEVYFKIIADQIKQNNNQVLIILPEIVLTTQLIDKFIKRFNFEPTVWHSSISPAKKIKCWQKIISGEARVIIGARSALFLPFKKLSMVIVEEEHDSSYKQEDGVIYNARDMSILKGYIDQIPILLISATSSIETYANILSNKYKCVKLTARFRNLSSPDIKIIDLKSENLARGKWLSNSLIKETRKTLENKHQALFFLNRRGYAPLTLCNDCGHRFICNNCSSWLVEHRSKKRLECHHCGNVKSIPKNCPKCEVEDSIIACGPGVERIEEEVKLLFPQARIALMTKDTIKTTTDAKKIVAQILNKEIDIIIGTQLIAKGHHFPDLALVGVIDADIGLSGGDLRAAERTYQLLEQVSGRAGRENTSGLTILQTYYPNNEVIKSLAKNDKDAFYKNEISARENGEMPPFARLASITLSAVNMERVKNAAKELVRISPLSDDAMVLGPSEGYPFKVRGKHRYRILVKTSKNFNIQQYIKLWLSQLKLHSSIFVKVDIDPYNFM